MGTAPRLCRFLLAIAAHRRLKSSVLTGMPFTVARKLRYRVGTIIQSLKAISNVETIIRAIAAITEGENKMSETKDEFMQLAEMLVLRSRNLATTAVELKRLISKALRSQYQRGKKAGMVSGIEVAKLCVESKKMEFLNAELFAEASAMRVMEIDLEAEITRLQAAEGESRE